jgi:hypothetical protein
MTHYSVDYLLKDKINTKFAFQQAFGNVLESTCYYYDYIQLYHQKYELDFLAHLAKGNVSFCHHLAYVVCRPITGP